MDLKNLGFNLYRDIPAYRTAGDHPDTVVFVGVSARHQDEYVLGVRVGFYGQHRFRLSYSHSHEYGLVGTICELDEDGSDYRRPLASLYDLTRTQMLRLAATFVVGHVAERERATVIR